MINAVLSVTQVIVIGGVLFFLYRFLLNSIGVEKLVSIIKSDPARRFISTSFGSTIYISKADI